MKEKQPEQVHDDTDFHNLRNHLLNHLGFQTADVDAALGTQVNSRTYRQVMRMLAQWLHTRPHK